MTTSNHKIIPFIVCIFSVIELIVTLFIYVNYQCESHIYVLYFIESSGIMGFLSTLFYFIVKELKTKHPNIYLILSNIYFVFIICVSLYWFIGLAIESRRFFDNFYVKQCQTIVFYFIFILLIGNYLIFVLLILYSLWFCFMDMKQQDDFYAYSTLIR